MLKLVVAAALGAALVAPHAAAQRVVITGRVTNAGTGAPVAGAQVSFPATSGGGATDSAGRYRLTAPRGTTRGQTLTVAVRMIGYERAERAVRVTSDSLRVDFALHQASVQLSEVLVTGADAQGAGRAERAAASPVLPAPMTYRKGTGYRAPAERRPAVGRYMAVDTVAGNTEDYNAIDENPFLSARANPRSTFSIDVDRASYSNVRRFITGGHLPPKDAVRIEELINYFSYDDEKPRGDEPFAVTTEVSAAPWSPAHKLVRVAIKGRAVDTQDLPASNLVFLVDVSGSMQSSDKLPLVKTALRLLVNELRREDRVAIVVYAGAAGLVLPSTPGDRKEAILDAIEGLEAGGSTAGGAGLRLAYDVARRQRVARGNNRVILATDGDFNVGESSDAAMVRLIEERRGQGVFLTVLGFGTGNLKDAKMEQLADRGNGNYAYIDNLLEARKVLVREMGGTLLTIAKDVKLQVELNPERVAGYRLIGYENRALRDEDFADDRKDAGELGAGHSVTALYEVIPVGAEDAATVRGQDPLRYQRGARPAAGAAEGAELMYVKLRYKAPDGERSRLVEHAVLDRAGRPSADFTFAAAVAAFGMLLRDSEHRGRATMEGVIAMAERSKGRDEGGYRAEFVRLAEAAQRLMDGREETAVRER
jgi:Ca-activated chloride channel family protein